MRDPEVTYLADQVPTCPGCGAKLAFHTGPGVPSAGDVTICLHCELGLLFDTVDGDLVVRLPATDAELDGINALVANVLKSAHEMTDN